MCLHRSLDFDIKQTCFDDTNLHYLEISAKCRECQRPIEFRGMPFGVTPAHPTMSLDGQEMTVPFLAAGEELTGNPPGFVGRMIGGRILPKVPKI